MRKWEWEHSDEEGRVCTHCKQYKTYEHFHKHSKCAFGFNTVCKVCRHPLSKRNYDNVSLELRIWQRAKTRATKHNLDFNLELSDIVIPDVCPIFKVPFVYKDTDYTASIDKINPLKGYVKGNIQIISNKANRLKSNVTKEELQLLLNYVSEGEI